MFIGNYVKWLFSVFKKKGNTQRGTLNKIIYVIVQSAFLTNNKKRLVRCTVLNDHIWCGLRTPPASSHQIHPEFQ